MTLRRDKHVVSAPPIYVIPRDAAADPARQPFSSARAQGPDLSAQQQQQLQLQPQQLRWHHCSNLPRAAKKPSDPNLTWSPSWSPTTAANKPQMQTPTQAQSGNCYNAVHHPAPAELTLAYTLIAHLRLCRDLPRRPRRPCTSACAMRVSSCLYTNTNVNTVPCPMPSLCVFVLTVYF
ncbi:uncharacterized protein ZBAI_02475 [Zygosaccharomyces bailii ISA1307]|nr:uncharacterized protein ZBAI_02475 [Zygosaccharomyces bailii ISA1307]